WCAALAARPTPIATLVPTTWLPQVREFRCATPSGRRAPHAVRVPYARAARGQRGGTRSYFLRRRYSRSTLIPRAAAALSTRPLLSRSALTTRALGASGTAGI